MAEKMKLETLLHKMSESASSNLDKVASDNIDRQIISYQSAENSDEEIISAMIRGLAMLATGSKYKHNIPKFFKNEIFGLGAGKYISDVILNIKGHDSRKHIAQYVGNIISNGLVIPGIEALMALNKPALSYSDSELNDLLLRRESISRLPDLGYGKEIFEVNAVDAVLKLSGKPLREYNSLLKSLEKQPGQVVFDSVAYLKPDDIDHDTIGEFFKNMKLLIKKGFASDTSSMLVKAMYKGSERMDFVIDLVESLSTNPLIKKGPVTDGYLRLSHNFIESEDEKAFEELADYTMKLIDVGVTNHIGQVNELIRKPDEVMDNSEYARRASNILTFTIAIYKCGISDELFNACQTKEGSALDDLYRISTLTEVRTAFTELSRPNIHKFARQVLANALVHKDVDFAVKYAKTLSRISEVNSLGNTYKPMNPDESSYGPFEENKERWARSVKVMGQDNVVDVLGMYRRRKYRSVLGVMVNALWNNPDMADSWCKTMTKLWDRIDSVDGEHRGRIYQYFGVENNQIKAGFIPPIKIGYIQMVGNLNRWLNDYERGS